MRVLKIRFALTVFVSMILVSFIVYSQNKSIKNDVLMRKNLLQHQQIWPDEKINLNKKVLKNSKSNNSSKVTDLTELMELPFQDSNLSTYEAAPVALSSGDIIILYSISDFINFSDDSLCCIKSTDGGITWIDKKVLISFPNNSLYYLTGLQTNSGRIIALWTDISSYAVMQMTYSDDNGDSWSSVISLPASSYEVWYPSISQSADSTIYLSYSRDISTNYSYADLVFRKSTDDGMTWSNEKILSGNHVNQNMGSIIPGNGDKLLAVYSRVLNNSWGIVKRNSTDGGESWGAENIILDSPINDDNTRVIRINNDTLYLVYLTWGKNGYYEDFYYLVSEDNGTTWSSPARFTNYAGYDGYITNLSLYNNKPFIAFTSSRWQQIYNIPHLWYGIIGLTKDYYPPPSVLYSAAYQHYFLSGKVETILGKIVDELGVQNVIVNLSLNGGAEYSLQMFDDGKHNDWGFGDGIYGVSVGPFSLGDHLDYSFSALDRDNNNITVHGFSADVLQHGSPINPNKGFEESNVGISKNGTTGWGFYATAPAAAVFQIVSDTVKEGNRALKVNVNNVGAKNWDIQAINQQFNFEPNQPYRYFIWAKSDKDNTFVDFVLGETQGAFFNEWLSVYDVTLTTEWQEFSFDFVAQSNTGRAPVHFSSDANRTSLPINFYIDDLRIVKLGSPVSVDDSSPEIPTEFSLSQNYPNPFNPTTKISFSISKKSYVTLNIYNTLGSKISELVREEKEAGRYEIDFNALSLPSGVYFYKLSAGNSIQTKKMVLLH